MATALANVNTTIHRALSQVHAWLAIRHSAFLDSNRLHNARSPPNILPDEILSYIFQLSSHDWVPGLPLSEVTSTTRSTNIGYSLGWITVSHVCHRWRDAALSYSALWVNPAVWSNQKWIEEMIRRSGDSPLDIVRLPPPLSDNKSWSPTISLHSCIAKYVPLHITRIRSLYIHGDVDELQQLFEALTDIPRSLRDLRVLNHEPPIPSDTSFSVNGLPPPYTLVLPDIMTSSDIPLRHLALFMVFVQWTWPLLGPGLESLNIRSRRPDLQNTGNQYSLSTPDECLDALTRMCSLEALTLHRAFPPTMDDRSLRLPVSMPRLRQIDFCGSVGNCFAILCRLHCPQLRHLKLEVTDIFPYNEDSSDLLSTFALNMASFTDTVQDLRLDMRANSWWTYHEYSVIRADKALEVVLSGDSNMQEDLVTAFVRFLTAVRCHKLHHLHLKDISHCIPLQSWVDALEPMQELEEIHFSGTVPTCFPASLSQPIHKIAEGISSMSFILPKLNVIVFNSIDFRPPEMANPLVVLRGGAVDGAAYLDALLSALKLRGQHGLSIIFFACRITKDVRRFIRQLKLVGSSGVFKECTETMPL